MRAALLLVLALTACGGGEQERAADPEGRPRVDSALCDDLRTVVAAREDGDAAAVRAASRRVLVQLGATPPAPEDVVTALRELEGGAGPDDGLDATVAAFVEQECGGR